MTTWALTTIGELTTNDATLGDGSPCGRLRDAALVVEDGRVVWVGPRAQLPAVDEVVDVAGAAVVPGFVDAHTHVVFAGERADEFAARMAGTPYDGGGIARTVEATRAASDAALFAQSADRVRRLTRSGVTTLEVKSGYALTLEGEVRLLGLAQHFTDETTFLGAHVVPGEFAGRRDDYVELVRGPMLDACAPRARWADVFCDRGAFDVDEADAILRAAAARGLGLRLHANQLEPGGGVQLAVRLGAASVDHCTYLSDDDVAALAGGSTVATLLPGAEFSTRSPYPSARRLLDAGVTVALATDCNPGTSYVTDASFVLALAVREMGMTPDEALVALTRGAAQSLRRDDIGHLAPGARADFLVLDAPTATHLAYRPAGGVVAQVYRSGERRDG